MQKTINTRTLETLAAKLKPLNRKLSRRQIDEITIASSELKTKQIKVSQDIFENPVFVTVFWYEVVLELPVENMKIDGSSLLGYIEITGNKDLILHPIAEDAAPIMESFRVGDIRCDHCSKKRSRKSTFIFMKDGQPIMIGKSCAMEYFGLDIAEALQEFINFDVDGFDPDSDRDGESFGGGKRYFDQQAFLAASLFWIRESGFAPARMEGNSTVSKAELFVRSDSQAQKVIRESFQAEYLRFTAEGPILIDKLGEIYQFFQQMQTTDSFLLNCRAAILDVNYSRKGLLACAVNAYFKEAFKELDEARRAAWAAKKEAKNAAEAEIAASTTHYGAIGQRMEIPVVIADKRELEGGDFGPVTLIKMFTENGSEITWFTSTSGYLYEVGEKFICRGTVKKHSEFRGVKTTQMSRCILKPVEVKAC